MPRLSHKAAIAAGIVLLLGSALFLIAVRGQALLLDLSAVAGLLCL